jgi:cytoskeletal protein CcmA (bactofilin family)
MGVKSNKSSLKSLKLLLATSALAITGAIGVVKEVNAAATVYPETITSAFSNSTDPTQWLGGQGPGNNVNSIIGTLTGGNRRVFADVAGTQVSQFIQNGIQVTAPVLIEASFSLTGGMPTPLNPINTFFIVDSTTYSITTAAANPILDYANIYFNGYNVSTGNYTNTPNSVVQLIGDNINQNYIFINFNTGNVGSPNGFGGTVDFVGTPTGTNMTFIGTLTNLQNIFVRPSNFLNPTQNVTVGNDVTLYNNATLQLPTGVNLTALNLNSDLASSATHLIMVGTNVVNAMIGQGTQTPITDAQLLASTGEFVQAVNFSGNVTLGANTTLILDNNFTAANILPGVNNGNLTVTGNSVINALIGAPGNNPIHNIALSGTNSIVEFVQPLTYGGAFSLASGVHVKFDASPQSVTGGASTLQITTAFNNTTVEFANTAATIVNAQIAGTGLNGTSSNINTMLFSGSNVQFNETFSSNNINFSNATTAAIVTVAAPQDLGANNITTAATTRIHQITTEATQNISGNVGSNTNPLGQINLANSNTLNIDTTTFYSDVQTTTNNTGKVNFVTPGSFSYSLGNSTNALSNITFQGNGTVNGVAYAQSITVNTGEGASFVTRAFDGVTPIVQTTNGLSLQGTGSAATFGANAIVNSAITAATNNAGTATFGASNNATGAVGTATNSLALVNFNGTGTTLNGNLYSQAVDIAAGSSITLNSPIVKAPNGIVFQGAGAAVSLVATTSNVSVTAPVQTTVNDTGTLTFAAGATTGQVTVTGSAGSATNALQLIAFNSAGNITGTNIYSQNMTIGSGNDANLEANTIDITGSVLFQGGGNTRLLTFNTNAVINANLTAATNGGQLLILGGGTNFTGNVGTLANPLGIVAVEANATLAGNIYLTGGLDIYAGVIANFNSAVVNTGTLFFVGAGAVANFASGVTFTGPMISATANIGTANFQQATVNSPIGTSAVPLLLVSYNGGPTAQNGNVFAGTVDIAAGVTTNFTSPIITTTTGIVLEGAGAVANFIGNSTITSPISVTTNNTGTVIFAGNDTITGALGSAGNLINLVEFNGTTSSLTGNAYAATIDVAAGSAVTFNSANITTTNGVVLQGVGATANFGNNITLNSSVLTTVNNTGSVAFGNNPTINGALGSPTLELALISFNGNATFSAAAYSQEIDIAAGKTVNFSGNAITTTNGLVFQGAGAVANFSQNVTVTGPILATTANTGTVNFNAGGTVGAIGSSANPIALVTYGSNSTENGDVYAQEVDIATGKVVTFASANFVTTNGLKLLGVGAEADFTNNVIFAGPVITAVNNAGTLKFLGTATVNGNVGTSTNLLALVSYAKNSTQTGNLYSDLVDVAAGATVNFNGSAVQTTNGVVLQGAGAVANFGNNITVTGPVLTTTNNTGTAIFNTNPTINGALGSPALELALITFNGNATLSQVVYSQAIDIAAGAAVNFNAPSVTTTNGIVLQGAGATANFGNNIVLNSSVLTTTNNTGNVSFGSNPTINGALGSPALELALITFNGNATLSQVVYSQGINVAAAATVDFNAAVTAPSGLTLEGAGASAVFGANATMTGLILAATNNAGNVTFNGPNTVNSQIGTPTASVALITYNGNVTQNGSVYSDEVDIDANSLVSFSTTNFSTVNGLKFLGAGAEADFSNNVVFNGPAVSVTSFTGTLRFLGTATVNGALGTTSNYLALVSYAMNSTQNGNVYAGEVDVAAGAGVNFGGPFLEAQNGVIMQGAGASVTLADNVHVAAAIFPTVNNTGTVNVGNNPVLFGTLGESTASLALVNFQGTASPFLGIFAQQINIAAGKNVYFSMPTLAIPNGIHLQGANAVYISNATQNITTSFIADINNAGNVYLTGSLTGNIGSSTASLAYTGANDATINGNVYSQQIFIDTGDYAVFNSNFIVTSPTSGLQLQGAGSSATFGPNVQLTGPILALVNNAGSVTFQGPNPNPVTSNIGTASSPLALVTYGGNITQTGNVYSTEVDIDAGVTTTFNSSIIQTTNGIIFQGAGAEADFAQAITLTSPVLTTVAGDGTVKFLEASTVSGALGNSTNPLALVSYGANSTQTGDLYVTAADVAAGATVNFNGSIVQTTNGVVLQGAGAVADFGNNITLNSSVLTTTNNTGTAIFNTNPTINGALGSPTLELALITFNGNATLSQVVYSQAIDIAAGAAVNFNAPSVTTTNGIVLQGAGATANFGNNVTLNSSVLTTVNNTGTVSFGNNPTINGELGSPGLELALITFNGNAHFNAPAYAQQINIAAGATVDFDAAVIDTVNGLVLEGAGATAQFNNPVTITGPILAAVPHAGVVEFLGTATVNNNIGSSANPLALVDYGANATQNGNVYSDEIDIAAATTTTFNSSVVQSTSGIIFQGAGAEADFDQNVTLNSPVLTTTNNTGTLKFFGNVTASGPFGSPTKFLELVQFDQGLLMNILSVSTINGNVYSTEVDIAAGNTTIFNSSVVQTTNGVVLQGAGATATFGNNCAITSPIVASVNNAGIANFGSNDTITGPIGSATNMPAQVNFTGTGTTLNGNAYAGTINVAVGASVTMNSSIVETTNDILLQGAGAAVNFGNNVTLNSSVLTATNNTGSVAFGNNPTINGDLGSPADELLLVTFNGNANLDASTYAQGINIAAGATVNFALPVVQTVNGITFEGAGAVANFANGATINSPILTTIANTGTANFSKNDVETGNFGSSALPLALATFTGTGNTINGSVYVQTMTVAAGASANINSPVVQTTNGVVLQGAGAVVSFGGNSTINSAVTTTANNTGTVNYGDNVTQNGNIGSNSNALSTVNYNGGNTLTGSLYAQTVNIETGKTVNFNGPLVRTSNQLQYQGAGSTAHFAAGVNVSGPITTAVPENGNTIFDGNVVLNATIGNALARTGNTTFTANNTQTLVFNQDIYSNTINICDATLNLTANRTLDGSSSFNGTTINFGQNTLTLGGGNSAFTGSPVFNVYFNNSDNSHLELSQSLVFAAMAPRIGSTLDLTGVTLLTFNINDQSAPPPPEGRIYYFYLPQDLTNILYTADDKVTVNSNNMFATWYYDNGILYQISDIAGGIGAIIGSPVSNQTASNALLMAYPGLAGDALDFLNDVMYLASNGDIDGARTALLQVLEAINPTDMVMIDALSDLSELVENRTDNVRFSDFLLQAGIAAAGDNKIKEDYSVWFEPFYSKSFQKTQTMQAGYNANAAGATFGVDTNIHDDTLIGAAVSFLKSKIRYKDIKAGNKSQIDSWIGTLYGMHEIRDQWFVQGILSLGTNKVDNTKPRINGEIARGKYRATSYGAEAYAGYKWAFAEHTVLTPIVGAKYSRFDAENYTETQTTFLNLKVKKKAYNKVEFKVGGKLDSQIQFCGCTVTPQVSAFVNYDASHKATKALVTLEGFPGPYAPYVGKKPTRTIYNPGAALAITKGPMEYELSYDYKFAKKWQSHQGSVKVRAKF